MNIVLLTGRVTAYSIRLLRCCLPILIARE